jgi:putative PIG3 family NAD(P)H quinone oxidoreductase
MRAVVLDGFGGPEVLVVREVPAPSPAPDELLIDICSAAVNRADINHREGKHGGQRPALEIPGLDVAGVVRCVGDRVTAFAPGDRVMALVGGGGYAEQIAVHERQTMRVPSGVGLRDASAIPEVWLTAWDALVLQGNLTSGRTALIHGGGSGVGTAAIQIVKALGGRVITTCSRGKVDPCRDLGADWVVDRESHDFVEVARDVTDGEGVDVVIDIVGGEYVARNLDALARKGRIVQVGSIGGVKRAMVPLDLLSTKRAALIGTRMRSRPLEEKCALTQRFAKEMLPLFGPAGPCRPVVDRHYPLGAAQDAHRHLESNACFGKIVLDVAPSMPDEAVTGCSNQH